MKWAGIVLVAVVMAVLTRSQTQTITIRQVDVREPIEKWAVEKLEEKTLLAELPAECGDYKHLFEKYDWDSRTAYSIMIGESSCDKNRVGDDYPIQGLHAVSCGLMQVRTLAGRPNCETLKDPRVNLEWAYKIYIEAGKSFTPWTVFNNRDYLRYQ